MKVNVINSTEVAYILRRRLGPVRHWDDVLTDMRRGRTSYCDQVLLPFCRLHDGRASRPYYRPADVKEFLDRVLAVEPAPSNVASIKAVVVDVDPADDLGNIVWQARKLKACA